ncbi:MAG TPA: alkaline phosphatase, partial [bacterium]
MARAPKNVVLFIGDGLSLAAIDVARYKALGKTGKLHMDRMPVAGFVRTCSADKLITDSAAAATALAAGLKTKNGMIGITPDGEKCMTILEACQKRGMSTGLVVTSSITHATPAAFASHVATRKQHSEIAEQLLNHRVNVLLGGGTAYFRPKSTEFSKRLDERDLINEARQAGYAFVETREAMLQADRTLLLGLFALDYMKSEPPEPCLSDMTAKALSLLSSDPDGFFLMVEGSQIDWTAAKNDAFGIVRQMLDFDSAIGLALDFAVQNDSTLVVATSDHETGGLALIGGKLDASKLDLAWGTRGHAGGSVSLYAYGPGAEALSGFLENTDIPRIIAKALGIA